MTTKARLDEADAASVAFHVALTEIGAQTVEEALAVWQDVPPNAKASTVASWLDRAIALVMGRRGQSRDLAVAYYRLARALRTGRTIPDPRTPGPASVTLTQLRREFRNLADPVGPSETPSAPTPADPPAQSQEGDSEADTPGGSDEDEEADRILIEEIDRLAEEEDRLAREAELELEIALEALGPSNQDKRNESIDPEAPVSEADAVREANNAQAGARQAAAAARVAMDGGRGTIWSIGQRDKRLLGYARISRTGTPCGWCAMLISRGPVYRSDASATYSDGDLYHDNCNCYAEPIWTRDQYAAPLFDLNRKYAEQWPVVTKGLSGKAAVSAWRRFIRQEQKFTRAQAARSTTSVQEA